MSRVTRPDTLGPPERFEVNNPRDVVTVRRAARRMAERVRMGLVPTTKLVTACSELARNQLEHAGGGIVRITKISASAGTRQGVEVVFEDEGDGIEDVGRAMSDGFSTNRGLGLGLSGSRRLVDEFELETEPGRGTRVLIRSWA